ncbi:septum formation inhibitor MinC [Zhengella mangrovi]|uniref:Probable septum site-determining protein MinC n=1 Tax=Zhengella mangrovi TaxID=1982044 RepID=A0A2G1QKV0_9HYPH|nr:septum site-determining protein MinC [Zhengella mangrovi]PHP66099.1 septum formation inhibitor MinC [Zhengella mangrovi]
MTRVLTGTTQAIRLKGRSFLATVLSPELPLDEWFERFDVLASRSAGYFLKRPVMLDVTGIGMDRDSLLDLVSRLGERGIRIMGIEGASDGELGPDLPPAMSGGLPASDLDARTQEPASGPVPAQPAPSLMVTEPVRSGQTLISDGDITIIGSVASGAEVVAGGSVHVYGTLRGRVSAGSSGNASARIFCRKLEAELVAIAGFYQTSEDLEPRLHGQAVQLWLDGESILAERFN